MGIDTKFVRGGEKLKTRITTIRNNIGLPALTGSIGELLLQRNLERFDRGVDPDGIPWAPLADTTLQRKKRGGYGDRGILVREGALRASIQLIRGGAGSIFTNTGAGVRIGIDDPEIVPYARAQNRGIPGRLKMRRFLGIGALDIKSVDAFMRRKAKQLTDIQ